MTTVHQLIQQLQKLDPNTPIYKHDEGTSLYLFQHTGNSGKAYYSLEHTALLLNYGGILLHDFQGLENHSLELIEKEA